MLFLEEWDVLSNFKSSKIFIPILGEKILVPLADSFKSQPNLFLDYFLQCWIIDNLIYALAMHLIWLFF